MRVRHLHDWQLAPRDAMALQRELAARVVARGDPPETAVRFVAGCDVAFDKARDRAIGAVVVLRYPELVLVERIVVEAPIAFPYVPGLLSFRETPLLAQAFERIEHTPDLVMVDGHGYAHPRHFGIACHIGLLLGVPAIGVAKSRLVGEESVLAPLRGSRADLVDAGEVIGSLLRTRDGVRPVYVSVGDRIALDAAERWVLRCARAHRLPEPTRLADRLAGDAKRLGVAAVLKGAASR
jgi:deoxyribonuclease V